MPAYDTVFVEPAAYASFVQTGTWPDRTMFVLEIRTSEHTGSIVTTGHFQRDLMGLEAEIKASGKGIPCMRSKPA